MIARRYQNNIFAKIWKDTLKKASMSVPQLTIQHIVTKIWEPTIAACVELLDSLNDHSIKLSDVDTYFKMSGEIQEEIHKLYNGVQFCFDKPANISYPHWILTAVHLMQQYWALQKTASAASIVLQLREKLNLTGDFNLIGILANKVNISIHKE